MELRATIATIATSLDVLVGFPFLIHICKYSFKLTAGGHNWHKRSLRERTN